MDVRWLWQHCFDNFENIELWAGMVKPLKAYAHIGTLCNSFKDEVNFDVFIQRILKTEESNL